MRGTILALAAIFGLAALPAESQAAPAVLHDPGMAQANLVLVAGGCGRGWYPRRYVDRYGRWRVRCVPNTAYNPYYPPPSRYYYAPRYY